MAYTRKFIILKREYSTLKGINPKGHCKLEMRGIRGIITVNIENAEVDNFYNVILISPHRADLIWNLGKIFTDSLGRGKGEYVFTQRELEAKNISIDKISAILIIREGNVLLGGYLQKEDGAIESYIESMVGEIPKEIEEDILPVEDLKIEEEPEIAMEAIEERPEIGMETIEEEPETKIETIEEEVEPVEFIEAIEAEIPSTPEVEVNIGPVDEIKDELPVEVETEEIYYKEPIAPELQEQEPDLEIVEYMRKMDQKNQTTNYVLSILRFFPYIDPFKYDLKGYNWWIVDLDSENEYRAFLPYFSYIAGGNNKEPFTSGTTCNQLMNKYGHYLFGLYNEGEAVKYFVYGIPGEFIQDEHPYRGENGFNFWYEGKDIAGYWIIYIDPMTGKPVYPEIPMVPME